MSPWEIVGAAVFILVAGIGPAAWVFFRYRGD